MERNGGYATLGFLYEHADVSDWKTKTPFASIRRIVQDKRYFFNIKPGLWALKSRKSDVLKLFDIEGKPKEQEKEFTHAYYQGLLLEIGSKEGYETFIPNQDKNKKYLNRPLSEYSSIKEFYNFTYESIISKAKTVDVLWFNKRKYPSAFWEIENTTDFYNSLLKFVELQDFNAQFNIVADVKRKKEYEDRIRNSAFSEIKTRVKFKDYSAVSEYHSKVSELYLVKERFYSYEG
ncbi:MAG TPA: hypothetical protein VHO28_14795 [Ignavibacteriales bacterium]|nr:hypothetical protein [Ignavibacteriales bacterium]